MRAEETTETTEIAGEGTSASMLSAQLVLSLKDNVTMETTETVKMDWFAWMRSAILNHATQTTNAQQERLVSTTSAPLSQVLETHATTKTATRTVLRDWSASLQHVPSNGFFLMRSCPKEEEEGLQELSETQSISLSDPTPQ